MIYVTHDQVEAMTLGNRICVMSHGYIQQVGKPLDVYDYPVNKFVAGFIGTPTMNLIDGKLTQSGDQVIFNCRGMEVTLTKEQSQKCHKYLGEATFGVRPEKLSISKEAPNDTHFLASVEFIEKLGDTQQVFLKVGDQSVTASAEAHFAIEAGDEVYLAPDMERIHIFAGDDEKNITM
jgi:multiple sugar transport system ATP-binding protein